MKPGVPTDHIDWIAQYAVEKKPDVIVNLGDHWDFPSLNSHEQPGSVPMEGQRYEADLEAGNEAMRRIDGPIAAESSRTVSSHKKRWIPRKIFLIGNHEKRADRVASNDPKWFGHIGSNWQPGT